MMGIVITMLYLLIGKRWTQCVFLFLLIFLISYSFYLLGIQVPPVFREVLDSRSESVSESKEAKSFICSYSSLYNSKHNIMIKESFAEYRHEYKNYYSREFRIDKNSIWFVARIDNLDAIRKNGYEERWKIDYCNNNSIILPIDLKDTIVIHIKETSSMKIIDSIVFMRIPNDREVLDNSKH